MAEQVERWEWVPGYQGLYQVSDRGRVLSFVRAAPGRELKTRRAGFGYSYVKLHKNGTAWQVGVHTLVLLAFMGPRPDGMECRHPDGDRANCAFENLCWGTPGENDQDRIRHGTFPRGSAHTNAKLTEAAVRQIRASCAAGMTHTALAREHGVTRSLVTMIVNGRRWVHVSV